MIRWRYVLRLVLFAALATAVGLLLLGAEVSRRYALWLANRNCPTPTRRPEDVGLQAYQTITFTTADGLAQSGWYIPSENGAAVILLQGIGAGRDAMLDEAALLAEYGYGAVLLDPRPCAGPDQTTTLGYREAFDAVGAAAFLQTRPEVNPNRIGVLGFSIGGAGAIYSAAQSSSIGAVVAMGNYHDFYENLTNTGGSPNILDRTYYQVILYFFERAARIDASRLSPISVIHRISPRPILLIFGEGEVESGRGFAQFAAAGEPKELWIVPGVGHGGYLQADREAFAGEVIGFFDRALPAP
ncbi:MAG: alpha/beta hydrolase [Anaerolineae bacterium]